MAQRESEGEDAWLWVGIGDFGSHRVTESAATEPDHGVCRHEHCWMETNDGVQWISNMLHKNQNLHTAKLETNTIYYIENLTRKYIYKNREKIRKTRQLKQDVIIILDFLIGKASVIGYMLRESIL